jgi:hypothetical protein
MRMGFLLQRSADTSLGATDSFWPGRDLSPGKRYFLILVSTLLRICYGGRRSALHPQIHDTGSLTFIALLRVHENEGHRDQFE